MRKWGWANRAGGIATDSGEALLDRVVAVMGVLIFHAIAFIGLWVCESKESSGNQTYGAEQEARTAIRFVSSQAHVASQLMAHSAPPIPQLDVIRQAEQPVGQAVENERVSQSESNILDEKVQVEFTNDRKHAGDPEAQPIAGDLKARYLAAIRASVIRQWAKLAEDPLPAGCKLVVVQMAGGSIMSAYMEECSIDDENKERYINAAMNAKPLPYAGFETVFEERIGLEF